MSGYYPLELFWDATYAIAISLLETHPEIMPESVGIEELASLIINLSGFMDDPDMATAEMLVGIQTAWYEEKHS